MDSSEKEKLIIKLRDGTCSEKDLQRIRTLLPNCEPGEAGMIMDLLWEYHHEKPFPATQNTEKIYQLILAGMDEDAGDKLGWKPAGGKSRRWLRKTSWQMAATVLLLVAVGLWWWLSADNMLTFTTGNGEQLTVVLPDSSKVQLNANSTLTYHPDWTSRDRREVQLHGEAYFSVTSKHRTGQKFAVITPDLTIEVLGTVFNVNSRTEKTEVFLEEGEIALNIHQQEAPPKLMQPGEMLAYSNREDRILINKVAPSPKFFTSWKDGVLIFESIPLAEVLEKIEQIYGIEFLVRDSANYQRSLRAGLPMEEIDLLIPMLEQSLDLKINKTESRYVIE